MVQTTQPRALRITVMLGWGESSPLFDSLLPLLEDSRAEVTGLFVEDDELFRLAALPFSQELCRLTGVERNLDPVVLERQIRIQARLARRALETARGLERARRSFRSARGSLAALLQRETREVDLVVIGPGTGLPRGAVPSRAARPGPSPVVVACTDSEAGDRAIAVGMQLARSAQAPLRVLAMAEDEAAADVWIAKIRERPGFDASVCRPLVAPAPETVVAAVRSIGGGRLVLEARSDLLAASNIRSLTQGLSCPVLLVR